MLWYFNDHSLKGACQYYTDTELKERRVTSFFMGEETSDLLQKIMENFYKCVICFDMA